MSEITTQAVVGKVVDQILEVQTLLTDYNIQALSRLDSAAVNQSSKLSIEEMAYRVAAASAILKGEAPPIREQSQLSTEQALRAENRIQDNAVILAKLGFEGELPPISLEILEECARTRGTLVLKFKTTLLEYRANLNYALGSDKEHLHLHVGERAELLAIINEEPSWVNVPNTVRLDTLGMSKVRALNYVPGSVTSDPMNTVLMLGYNNLQTGEQLVGFTNKFTFTNQKNTLVGSHSDGIRVLVGTYCDSVGDLNIGLAPRLSLLELEL